MAETEKMLPCDGCGNADPQKRCINCYHDFGDGNPMIDAVRTRLLDRPPPDLPPDVRELVIAARYVMDQGDMSDDHRRLDRALEAFASRVPYDDELPA